MIIYGWGGAYNKRDWTSRWGACGACGNVGHLMSFSGTMFFNIYYIPLIPHGNSRIIDLCCSCKQSRSMPLKEWKTLRSGSLERALKAFQKSPQNRVTAGKALDLVAGLGDEEQFQSVAVAILEDHGDDAELMAHLGGHLIYFGKLDEAKGALQRSLEIESTEEAQATLDFLEEQTMTPPPTPPGWLTRFAWLLVLPAILFLVMASLITSAINAEPRNVFLVSGLDVPYSVLVNGNEVQLPAQGRVRLDVPFGHLSVTTTADESLPIAPVEVELETSFFNRSSVKLLFVINPDRSALLTREQVIYTQNPSVSNAEGNTDLLLGKPLHAFDDVDYAFEEAPDELSMESRNSKITRIVVDQLKRRPPLDRAQLIWDIHGKEACVAYCKKILAFTPQDSNLFSIVVSTLDHDEGIDYSKPILDRRPVLVTWHHYYQQLMQDKGHVSVLLAEYRELLAADPKNNSLRYLVSRLIEDPEKSFEMAKRSTLGENPEPFGYYSMSFGLAMRCDFMQALGLIEKAIALKPQQTLFKVMRVEMWKATENWDALEKHCREELQADPSSYRWSRELVEVLSAAKKPKESDKAKRHYILTIEDLDESVTPEQIDRLTAQLTATQAQWSDNSKVYAKAAHKIDDTAWKLRAALAEGDSIQASKYIAQEDSLFANSNTRLALYALALSTGEQEFAKEQLGLALKELRAENKDGSRVARWFAADAEPPSLRQTYRATMFPAQRKLLLVALGCRHPAAREGFFRDAKKLNFDHDAWYFPVERIIR